MLTGYLNDLLQNFLGIQRTGGVIGVDDNDGLCFRGYLAFDIRNIRKPFLLLVTYIMYRLAAGQVGTSRP
jgi:hypothetical protein